MSVTADDALQTALNCALPKRARAPYQTDPRGRGGILDKFSRVDIFFSHNNVAELKNLKAKKYEKERKIIKNFPSFKCKFFFTKA